MRTGRGLAVIALLNVVGTHWIVLQSIAWGRILLEQPQQFDFAETVQKTLSGAHPCGVCKAISDAQERERTRPAPVDFGKIVLLPESGERLIFVSNLMRLLDEKPALFPLSVDRPESPPPRYLLI